MDMTADRPKSTPRNQGLIESGFRNPHSCAS
jgi:hypothetical protein